MLKAIHAQQSKKASREKAKAVVADELRVVDGGSFTEVHLPLNRQIASSDYRAFVLKKDPQTGRPFRVVLDITADKTTGVVNNSAGSSSKATTKPSTGTTGKSAATVSSGCTNGGTAQVSNKPVVGSRPVKRWLLKLSMLPARPRQR